MCLFQRPDTINKKYNCPFVKQESKKLKFEETQKLSTCTNGLTVKGGERSHGRNNAMCTNR